MGDAARQRALVEFDERRVVERVLDTYREIAAKKGVTAVTATLGGATSVNRYETADALILCAGSGQGLGDRLTDTSKNESAGSEPAPDGRIGPRIARAALQIRGDGPLVLLDLVITLVTYTLLYALRFDFSVPERYLDTLKTYLPAACAVHVIATWLWGGYGRTWRYASIDEARRLLCAGATAGHRPVPRVRVGNRARPLLGAHRGTDRRHLLVRHGPLPVAPVRVPPLR